MDSGLPGVGAGLPGVDPGLSRVDPGRVDDLFYRGPRLYSQRSTKKS